MHNFRKLGDKIVDFFDGGERDLERRFFDTSKDPVRLPEDPRVGKVVRSKYGFTGTIAEVWRKSSGDETFVIDPPNGTRTYWANREVEILSDAQVALIGHEKCVYCGEEVGAEEEWGYATEYERELLLVNIIAMPNDILCAKCAEDIEAK